MKKLTLSFFTLMLLLGLAGCSDDSDEGADLDQAGAAESASDTADEMGEEMQEAGEEMDESMDEAGEEMEEGADEMVQ